MSEHTSPSKDHLFFIEKLEVFVHDFEAPRWILDVGGDSEGVIGILKGEKVVTIDFRKEELEESAE